VTGDADRELELLFELFAGLKRKAPGSETSTKYALARLGKLPPSPTIVDMGCGAGASTLVLAAETGGSVTAIDLSESFLDELNRAALAEGLSDNIKTICADMATLPLPDATFDVVWSEGSIYLLGFKTGLQRWRRLLRPHGWMAVTEVSWLTKDRPTEAVEFWEKEYPSIASVEGNVEIMHKSGFESVDHFVLPKEDWSTHFYQPLMERLEQFRSEHPNDASAQAVADAMDREIELWKSCGGSYGYVFYLGRLSTA
jgi:ubiquinone/menaquinone biosynthesis C-methylase UbiE